MDNIAVELEAFSCLLPLLALMFLAVQFCRVSGFKSDLPLAYTIQDHYSSSYEGLISINNESKLQIDNYPCSQFELIKSSKHCSSIKDYIDQHEDQFQRQGTSDQTHKFLQGCRMGLSKMNQINKAYFRKCQEGLKNNFSKKNKVRKNAKRNSSFEPTRLSIIVEGLQY